MTAGASPAAPRDATIRWVQSKIRPALRRPLRHLGYELRRTDRAERFEEDFERRYAQAAPFTMTSKLRMYACWQAAHYVAAARVPGDVVECGVWRGGATMMLAGALADAPDTERGIWLYDTFAGMSEPTEHDAKVDGRPAREKWEASRRGDGVVDWCFASLDEVRANVQLSGYPAERFSFVRGRVEDTIPRQIPERIAILRLDTDWYESTRHELEHLFPRVVRGGVVLIDDYGEWVGARRAVDEYVQKHDARLLLARTDHTGRIAVKAF